MKSLLPRWMLGVLVLALIGWGGSRWLDQALEAQARQKLDRMLGQLESGPEAMPMPLPTPRPDFSLLFPEMPASPIRHAEYADRYEITVPLSRPEEAAHIRVSVQDRFVEVTGALTDGPVQTQLSYGFSVQAVQPDQVTRTVEQENGRPVLRIRIPKANTPSPALPRSDAAMTI